MATATSIKSAVQFEEDFIYRSCRTVTTTPDISITELVANAWDAGAINVFITIPDEEGEVISVEDDGTGMSDEQFMQRWMTLTYDRQKRQGKKVEFPCDIESYSRIAYGRNGIGRHGMLCFSNYYFVETWKDGICNKYDISVSSGDSPFTITDHISFSKEGHGTKIYTYVNRHLPNVEYMIDIISARFLYDPRFTVKINNKTVDLLQHKGFYEQKDIVLENGVSLNLTVIDSTKTARKSQLHGIAFWICGRLVGNPSWTYDNFQFLDGRLKPAKRYTIVVQTSDLIDEVLPDWTGFIGTLKIKEVYIQLKKHIDEFISKVMYEQIKDIQFSVIEETREQLEGLQTRGKREVSAFIEEVTTKNPIVSQDFLISAVQAVISIEKARKGEQLLMQLSKMSPDDLDKLSDMLNNWDINDVLAVLDEIDKRIVVIEAINRIFEDKNTDELHTLHPLVLNARWLFGSEFDSPMFVSNSALSTVVKTLFKEDDYDLSYINNPRKRPDIVVLKNYSLKAVCTDRIDSECGGIMKPDQILIIELKRGGFEITPEEVGQAENYVRQIRKSAVLHKNATIHAFVVGCSIGDVDTHKETLSGIIDVITFGQLVETSSQKLFRLREQLNEHYNSMGNESIVEQALKQPVQLQLNKL